MYMYMVEIGNIKIFDSSAISMNILLIHVASFIFSHVMYQTKTAEHMNLFIGKYSFISNGLSFEFSFLFFYDDFFFLLFFLLTLFLAIVYTYRHIDSDRILMTTMGFLLNAL